jgi:hypothetical protein
MGVLVGSVEGRCDGNEVGCSEGKQDGLSEGRIVVINVG